MSESQFKWVIKVTAFVWKNIFSIFDSATSKEWFNFMLIENSVLKGKCWSILSGVCEMVIYTSLFKHLELFHSHPWNCSSLDIVICGCY